MTQWAMSPSAAGYLLSEFPVGTELPGGYHRRKSAAEGAKDQTATFCRGISSAQCLRWALRPLPLQTWLPVDNTQCRIACV